MKVVITGGTGFIGHHLARALSKNYEVIPLARSLHYGNRSMEIPIVLTDYSIESLREILAGCDAVIHLAALRLDSGEGLNMLKNSWLDYLVFQAAIEAGVKHVLYTSSRSVYGLQPIPWLESTPTVPDTLYALAKLHAEETAAFFIRRGACITTLRIAQVFGLGEYENSAITTFIRNAYLDRPITLTTMGVFREYVYMADLVSAIERVLAKPTSGTYNLGSGEIISLEKMARDILRAFGRDEHVQTIPNPKYINEKSLMDSSLFREFFSWTPNYNFADAAKDIAMMLENEKTAKNYGL